MSDLLNRIDLRFDHVEAMLKNYTVSEAGCWEYQGKKRAGSSYGHMAIYCSSADPRKRFFSAHRVSFAFHSGVDPGASVVRHTCDNPCCINPDHLILGTHEQNMRDMVDRKRSTIGEANPGAKVTEEIVLRVVDEIKAGRSNTAISSGLPISHSMVSLIRHGKSWTHVLERIGYNPDTYRKFSRLSP